MSRFLRRISRVGKRNSKFFYEITVHSIHNFECDLDDFVEGTRLFVCCSRRKKRYWTGACVQFENGEGEWRQTTLTFPVTLYHAKGATTFEPKEFQITVYAAVSHSEDNSQKSRLRSKTQLASCTLDIAKFGRIQGAEDTLEVPLTGLSGQKCTIPDTRLLITVKSRWVKDGTKGEMSEDSSMVSMSTMFGGKRDDQECLGEGLRLCDFAREFKRKSFIVYGKVQEIMADIKTTQGTIDTHFTNITARLENAQQSLGNCCVDQVEAISNVTKAVEACRQNVDARLAIHGQHIEVNRPNSGEPDSLEASVVVKGPPDLESDVLSESVDQLTETFEHTYSLLQRLLAIHEERMRELGETRREFAREELLSRQSSLELEAAEAELEQIEGQMAASQEQQHNLNSELEDARANNKQLNFRLKALRESTHKLKDNLALPEWDETTRRRINTIQHMKMGSDCWKFSSKGKRQTRYMELTFDEGHITWSASRHRSRFTGPSQVALKDIVGLVYGPGQMPAVVAKEVFPWRCFSIITKNRLYDFYMQSDEDTTQWFLGLQYLLEDSEKDVRLMSRHEFLTKMSLFKFQVKVEDVEV